MKNLSLLLNVILFIAVGVLYYFQFSGKKENQKKTKQFASTFKPSSSSAQCFAYVDLDSLNEKISYIKNNRKALEKEQEAIETEWEASYRNLENKKNNFLKRGNAITQSEAEAFQNELIQEQQQVDTKKQSLTQKLNEKSYKFMDDIQQKLKGFLEDYNKDKRFTYIFSSGNGLDYMVYKDSSYNITSDVITGMNEMMSEEK
jgi:outer membrane protein